MKHLKKFAGISILLTLIFMVAAFFQFQPEESNPSLPEQITYFLQEGWSMALSDNETTAGSSPDDIIALFQSREAAGQCQKASLPYKSAAKTAGTVIFQNTLPQNFAGLALDFSSANAAVDVILDGTNIYHFDPTEGGKTELSPESDEHLVILPNRFQYGVLYLTLTALKPGQTAMLGEICAESRDVVMIGIVENSIGDVGRCLLILIMSVIMLVLALVRHYTGQPPRGELYLGLDGLTAALYCFIGMDALNTFYNLPAAYEMQEYLILLLPLFLVLYFERSLHTLYPRRFSILLCYVSIHALLQIFLHVFGIRDIHTMVHISAVTVFIACATAAISLFQCAYSHKSLLALFTAFSTLGLLSGGIANLILNMAQDNTHVNIAGQYSMTVFAIAMAAIHIYLLSKEYRADAEMRINQAEQQNIRLAQAKQEAEAARQEALAANEAKGRFLAHMSHEIRTPINAVLGMDEMILRESSEPPIKEYAMDIYTAGQTLLALINDILDFSKIESGKMEIVPAEYDLSSLIHDLSSMAFQRADSKNLMLDIEVGRDLPSRLYGDDVRIRQVLTNLLTNAVKYTHKGTVWLRVQSVATQASDRARKKDTAVLHFEVEDTGIGIREKDLPKLTAEFERIEEGRNRTIEGTGLGMSITLQLLSLLGSQLHVESTYGKGSRFYFDLEQKIIDATPIGNFEARIRQMAENYSYHAHLYAPDAQVLVVDDNAVNRKVLRNLLKETNIQVSDATGGMECLRLVQEAHFDLIFLDHMMPEMDGIETLHRIRQLSDFPCQDTPIVVLTANAVSGAKENYLAEGFDGFLSKPVVPEKLEQLLLDMLPKQLLLNPPVEKAGAMPAALPAHSETDFLDSLPHVDGLDWQYAWMHLPDKELLEYTLKEFYAQIDSSAKHLSQAYEQTKSSLMPHPAPDSQQQIPLLTPDSQPAGELADSLAAYRIQVHAMKSLAATVGLLPLFGVAKLLEEAARDGNTDTVLSITPAFLTEWRSYSQKLSGVLGIASQPEKEITDISVIQALVEMVRLSMQEMEIGHADQLISQLRSYHYKDEIGVNIQKLAEAVTGLDTDEAERLADILLRQLQE